MGPKFLKKAVSRDLMLHLPGPPKLNKNQHKTDFERVQEGSENTGHMQVILEGVQDRFLVAEAAPGRLGDGFWKAPGAI